MEKDRERVGKKTEGGSREKEGESREKCRKRE